MAVNKVIYNGETLIDLTEDTVNEDSLLEGFIAHTPSGRKIVGILKVVESINGKTGIISKLEVSDINELVDLLASKQDSLIPGANIIIAEDGKTISAIVPDGGKIDHIKVNGTEQTITDKTVNISVPTNNNQLVNGAGYITEYTETDPTVPSWAKQASKPTYTAAEVGALPNTTVIPTNNNQLTNGAGYITSAGSCAYATSAGSAPANGGNADCVRTQSAGGFSHGNDWRMFFRHDGVYFRPKFMQSDGSVADNATAVNYADTAGSSNSATYANASGSYNVSCLRNQALLSYEATPTAQGEIYWVYQ